MAMSFGNLQTPTGELNARRVMNPSAIDLASVEYIVSKTSIAEAWKKVKSNQGKPGVDNISIEQFPNWGRPKWTLIKEQVETGIYLPTPVLRVEIPKEPSGKRLLGIPCVLDRVLMQSIAKVLSDMFNPTFSLNSYGYMPGRSVQQSARQAQGFYQQGYGYQIDIDLEKFFDTVDHDILMDRMGRKVKDKGLMKLLGRFLRAGVVVDGRWQPTRLGVLQGSPVSPILSNILLDELDTELEARGHQFVRYADDVAIFCQIPASGRTRIGEYQPFSGAKAQSQGQPSQKQSGSS
jgi:RNA-directed DNA polymerase